MSRSPRKQTLAKEDTSAPYPDNFSAPDATVTTQIFGDMPPEHTDTSTRDD